MRSLKKHLYEIGHVLNIRLCCTVSMDDGLVTRYADSPKSISLGKRRKQMSQFIATVMGVRTLTVVMAY